jgi:uncharacterized protein YndB with AHSA1/START domain
MKKPKGGWGQYLTKRELVSLKEQHITVEIRRNNQHKRLEIVWHTPDGDVMNWVLWKVAVVKGGKLKRLALDEGHKGNFYKLIHRSRGKGWHSQGQSTRDWQELVAYAARHDFLPVF